VPKRKKKKKAAPKAKPKEERRPKAGRPPEYEDPELRRRVLRGLSVGWPFQRVADFAGISLETLRLWRKSPPPKDAPEEIKKFFGDIKSQELLGELVCLEAVISGAPGWQGPAWRLERLRPKEYGRPAPVTLDADEDTEIQISFKNRFRDPGEDDGDPGDD